MFQVRLGVTLKVQGVAEQDGKEVLIATKLKVQRLQYHCGDSSMDSVSFSIDDNRAAEMPDCEWHSSFLF